jgi:hypothetical protein
VKAVLSEDVCCLEEAGLPDETFPKEADSEGGGPDAVEALPNGGGGPDAVEALPNGGGGPDAVEALPNGGGGPDAAKEVLVWYPGGARRISRSMRSAA